MLNSFQSDLVSTALDHEGIWLAPEQGEHGVRLVTDDDPRIAADALSSSFTTEHPWRVESRADTDDHSRLKVRSEIDMTTDVIITHRA